MSDKKRRWYIDQMCVACVHKNILELIRELREIEKHGLDGDTFTLKLVDMTDEEFERLQEL